jgi:predicted TIM-barrel fold metal-dependent hydrolase
MTLAPPPQSNRYRLISADSHVLEPADLWTSRVAERVKDRVPRIEWLPRGGAWIIDGVAEPIAFGFTMSAGRDKADLTDWIQPEELPVDSWDDPAWRVATMSADGLDAEVLFPNRPFQGVVGCTDPELHLAMVQAYNDWLSDFCAYDPTRLAGLAAIPNRGVADAVAEIERCATKPGIVGFLLTAYPHGDTTITPEDDPVWAAVAATGKTLDIHIFLDASMPFNVMAEKLPGTAHFYDCPHRLRDFILSGVLERFPDLRIVFHEVDCGWIPFYASKLDQIHARSGLSLPHLPSDYIRDRFWYTFIHDPVAIANREWLGADRMLWSNDYPHIATDWPNSWLTINSQFRAVPMAERDQILWRNAAELFGLLG